MSGSIKSNYTRLRIIRWIARVLSVLSILFLVFFFFGEGFDVRKITTTHWIGFLFFPVGLVIGFIVGWKNDLIGGSISLISLFGFYFVYGLWLSDEFPIGPAFAVFALPAFLFIAAGIYARSTFFQESSEAS